MGVAKLLTHIWAWSIVLAVAIGSARPTEATIHLDAQAVGTGPYYLDKPGETYLLSEDVTTPGSALVFAAKNVTLDLNKHTLTFGTSSLPRCFGVAIPPSYPNPSWVAGTDIAVYKDNTGATIKNGSIVQGPGHASGCAAIKSLEQRDITVSDLRIAIFGDDTFAIKFTECSDLLVTRTTIVDSTTVISNRHQGRAAIDLENTRDGQIAIFGNTIHNARQWGIRVSRRQPSTVPGYIYNNKIYPNTIVANGYGIGVHGDLLEVFDNEIHAVNGRGIHIETCNLAKVHNNSIEVLEQPSWSDTRASAHGIKLERCTNAEVYFNHVVSQGLHETVDALGNGSALSITVDSESNNRIHHNTFIANHLGGLLFDPEDNIQYSTAMEVIWAAPDSKLRIEHNTFITQDRFLTCSGWRQADSTLDVGGILIRDNTWKREETPIPTRKYDIFFFNTQLAGLRLIDNVGGNFRNFGIAWPWSHVSWGTGYSGTVRVVAEDGAPIPGTSIAIRNSDGFLVAKRITGAQGEAPLILEEFTASVGGGDSLRVVEANPYTFEAILAKETVAVRESIRNTGFEVLLEPTLEN